MAPHRIARSDFRRVFLAALGRIPRMRGGTAAVGLLAGLAAMLTAGSANATMVLLIDNDPFDSQAELRIEDGDAQDQSPAPGIISFSGMVGATGIDISLTATSKPWIGLGDGFPGLLLSVDSFDDPTPEPTKISLTDTDFNSGPSPAVALIDGIFRSGEPTGTVDFDYFYGPNNNEFENVEFTVDPAQSDPSFLIPFDTSPIDMFAYKGLAEQDVGSLTLDVIWDAPGTTEGNFTTGLVLVPEPGTAALLGLGLVGLGAVRRSRREERKATA